MASLALSVAQGVLAKRFTTSRHGLVFRYVTHCSDLRGISSPHAVVLVFAHSDCTSKKRHQPALPIGIAVDVPLRGLD
jgi:hypothetical protein